MSPSVNPNVGSRRRPLVLAHRGACRRARENTLEAFAIARELGADGVELDVRRTRDGVLVLHHDPAIEGIGVLAEVDSAQLWAEAPWVPTLAAALDELRGLVVNVEVKCLPDEPDHDADRSVMRAVVALLAEHDALATAVVSSFELAAVDAARALEPRLMTGFLLTGLDPTVADGARLTASHGHEWFHPLWPMLEAADTAAVVGPLHDAGVRTNVWTLDDPEAAVRLAAAGVDGVISNEPEVILAAFA